MAASEGTPPVLPVHIRPEAPADITEIHHVLTAAFGRPQEAALVAALRREGVPTLSLVAVHASQVVGHLLLSPVIIKSSAESFPALGLGPLAVSPPYQRKGIGEALVRAGLEYCLPEGHEIVLLVGHPDYYARFGFAPAAGFGLTCEFPVPESFFLALELRPGALQGTRGLVFYHPQFHSV